MSDYNYTHEMDDTSSNIYFLNDRNFVDSLDTTIYNPIPSLKLISALDKRIPDVNLSSILSNEISTLSSGLSTLLSIEIISARTLEISAIETSKSYTDSVSSELSSKLSDKLSQTINELSHDVERFEDDAHVYGHIIASWQQEKGKVDIKTRRLISSDISGLITQNQVEGLTLDLNNRLLSSVADDKFISQLSVDEQKKQIVFCNPNGECKGSFSYEDFIVDGFLDEVEYDENCKTLTFTWNTDAKLPKQKTIINLSSLIDTYEAGSGLILDGKTFNVDFGKVTPLSTTSEIQTYVTKLSGDGDNLGIVKTLSNDISTLFKIGAKTLKYNGHIIDADVQNKTLIDVIHDSNLVESGKIENGSVITLQFTTRQNERITTKDGIDIGNGDIIVVHNHGENTFIDVNDLSVNKNIFRIKAGASYYDVFELSAGLSTDIIALSTSLSSDITALSTALSTEISAETIARNKAIEALSTALSTDIDDLSTALSTEISAETIARKANDDFLSGQINTLSDGISADVKALSTALSADIDALSNALSIEISAETKAREEAIKALEDKLSSAWQFRGVKAAVPTDNAGYKNGDVIIVNKKFTDLDGSEKTAAVEYAFDGENWQQLGDESSGVSKFELKTAIDDLSATVSAEIDADVEALSTDLSTDLSAEIEVRKENDEHLSTKIDGKISAQIGDNAKSVSVDTLTMHKISDEKYAELLKTDKIVETDIYVISSDYIDGYGEQVKNIANGEEETDAATYGQLSSLSTSLSADIIALSTDLSIDLSSEVEAREKNDAYLSTKIDGKIYAQIGDNAKPVSVGTLTMHKISDEKYAELLKTEGEITSTDLYIVSSEYVTGYNKQIIDVGEPQISSDAATKSYVDNISSDISSAISHNFTVEIEKQLSTLQYSSPISEAISSICWLRDMLSTIIINMGGQITLKEDTNNENKEDNNNENNV